jgi:biotin transport system substrate-specific component
MNASLQSRAPVFAAGGGLAYSFDPTGGYLLAFPAADIVGAIAGRSIGTLRPLTGLLAGALVIQGGGAAWLAASTGDLEQAMRVGVGPFLLFAILKVALVLLISMRIRPQALELF